MSPAVVHKTLAISLQFTRIKPAIQNTTLIMNVFAAKLTFYEIFVKKTFFLVM